MDGRPWLFCLAVLLLSPGALAQPPAPQQASYEQPVEGSLVFTSAPARVGLRTKQWVDVQLTLKARSRQGAQLLEESEDSLTKSRCREVVVAKVEWGLATAAHVSYVTSQRVRTAGEAKPDAIAGKRYYCERVGESLRVLLPSGETPPQEEFELVAENMATLGKPNPLAGFLSGKRVRVGQKLEVPSAVARQLVGFNSDLGEVSHFELTLKEIVEQSGMTCGRFLADLEAQRSDASQMRLIISGPILIEAATCRAVDSELSGPIGMSETLADPRGQVQVDSTGRLKLSVVSRFGQSRSGL